MKKTLKSMSAAECSSERSRHRVALGHLALARMRNDTTATEVAVIDGKMLKLRRRISRLDRRIEVASRPVVATTADDAAIETIVFHGA